MLDTLPPELPLALAALGLCVIVLIAGQIIDRRAADPLKPRLLPWRTLIVIAGSLGFLIFLYIVSLFRPPAPLL